MIFLTIMMLEQKDIRVFAILLLLKKAITFPAQFYSEQIHIHALPVLSVCFRQGLEIQMQHLFSVQEKSGKKFLNLSSLLSMAGCRNTLQLKILFLEFLVTLLQTAELTGLWNLTEMRFSLYLWMRE